MLLLSLVTVLITMLLVSVCRDLIRLRDELETLEAHNQILADKLGSERRERAYNESEEFARRSQAAYKGHETRRKKRAAQHGDDIETMIGDNGE